MFVKEDFQSRYCYLDLKKSKYSICGNFYYYNEHKLNYDIFECVGVHLQCTHCYYALLKYYNKQKVPKQYRPSRKFTRLKQNGVKNG